MGRPERPRLRINARLVKEKDRARARELRRLLIHGAVIVIPLLIYVWQRVDFIRLSYRVEELASERKRLQDTNRQLTIERSSLRAPDRIERLARRQLGMVDPTPEEVRRVTVIDGRVDEVQGPVAGTETQDPGESGLMAAGVLAAPPVAQERR
jgi:cell division protein FtsL